MPIYEYHCHKCNNIFEEWTSKVDDQSTAVCPDCGTDAERIMSNTSFVLKGGGWYVTDYGYRKGKTENSTTTPSTDKPAADKAASAPSAPAEKATTSNSSQAAG